MFFFLVLLNIEEVKRYVLFVNINMLMRGSIKKNVIPNVYMRAFRYCVCKGNGPYLFFDFYLITKTLILSYIHTHKQTQMYVCATLMYVCVCVCLVMINIFTFSPISLLPIYNMLIMMLKND